MVLIAIRLLGFWVEVSPFVTGILLQYIVISKIKTALSLGPKFQSVKGRLVVKNMSAHALGKYIFDCFTGGTT